MLFGHAHRADVAVDRRRPHRDRGDITHHVAVVNRHVGHAAADIHHGHAFLLLVGQQHRLGRGYGVRRNAQHLDSHPFEGHVEPLHRGLETEDEVERGRELLAERPHGILHLLIVVHHIVLGYAVHDGLVVGRLHVAHAVEQRIDVLLIDTVLRIVDKDVVHMPGTAHEVARNTGIGLGDADSQLLLGLRHGFADGAAHQFDILNLARIDPLDGFRHDAHHIEPLFGVLLADSHHDVRRTQIDGNGIILSFHGIILLFLANHLIVVSDIYCPVLSPTDVHKTAAVETQQFVEFALHLLDTSEDDGMAAAPGHQLHL